MKHYDEKIILIYHGRHRHLDPLISLIIARIPIRQILRWQTTTRHTRLTIIAPIDSDMATVTQIATPTDLDLIVLIEIVKGGLDLCTRHANRVLGVAIAFEHGCATVVCKGREKIVDDGVCVAGQDIRGVGGVEICVVILAVGDLAGLTAD